MTALSAVLITQDEEAQIQTAVESVSFCDEIVVVDSGSRDRTRELAKAAGARVLVRTPWPGFAAQRNAAVEAASHDWILALDADERVTPELRDEILALRSSGFGHDGYRIPRVAFYLGRWIRATDWYPDPQLRLFDRRKARWQARLVHESVKVEGRVGRLASEIEHHPYRDVSHHMRKIDDYTTLWAQQAFESGQQIGALGAAAATAWAFLRNYVLRGGVGLGGVGLTVSILNTYYTFAKLAKLQERCRDARAR